MNAQKPYVMNLRERYGDFYRLVDEVFTETEVELVNRALESAAELLGDRVRYDHTPLLDHSVAGAKIVTGEVGLGRNSTIATLLHDVYRLGLIDKSQTARLYGSEVADILDGMNLISGIETKTEQSQVTNFRDLIISYSTDPRVILIKLADRLEVMRNLQMFPPDKQIKKSWESMNLYAQIAHKLGLYTIKSELEDLSLSYLEPESYNEISAKLAATATEREQFIKEFIRPFDEKLSHSGIKYHIKSRTKSVYSIWRKMRNQNVPFEEIYDIFALRIIIDCPVEVEKMQCWGVYSIVTDFYTPNPERMRDWISIPKSNGYESLHTTVVTDKGRWVEIQIRSERMDEVAERGIAAHWRYKGVGQGVLGHEEWLGKLRELIEESDKVELATKFNTRLSSGEVFVFTPKGDLRKLPEGATVLDFAFDIHSGVGSSCVGARIKDRNVSIREPLRNGDVVNILTSKSQHPKADWLNIAVTSKARSRIKVYLREEEAKVARLGREELERKMKNWKFTLSIDEAVNALCRYYKVKSGLEIYGMIATEKIDMTEIKDLLTRYVNEELFESQTPKPKSVVAPTPLPAEREGDALVIDESIRGLDYKMARCCNPIFGDDVFGFTTVNSGITIHRNDCPNARRLKEMYPYRVMPARWRASARGGSFVASIRVVAEDSTGMLNRITELISTSLKINIRSMNLQPVRDNRLAGTINVEVTGAHIVDVVVFSLLKLRGVEKAYRVK